ncbi:MAG: TolC family outer membrane protein [Alphaproteobacteria bacterium]|nr:TolC family outer membrane protein [Alphaproteobacteria bacterium]
MAFAQDEKDKSSPEQQQEQAVTAKTQTLQSVLALTYLNNPSLMAARSQLRAVQENLPQALSGWLPSVTADAAVTASNSDQSAFSSQESNTVTKDIGLSVNQNIYRGGSTFAQVRAAKHAIKAAAARLIAMEQDVLLQTATVYMDVVRARALLELANNNKEVIARQSEATQDRFTVGELTKTDVEQANARLADAQAQIITARGNLRASEALFEQLTGFRPEALETPYPEYALPETLDVATQSAESKNPYVMAAISEQKAAEEDVESVFGELLPQISLSANWDRSYDPAPGLIDQQTSKSIGVSASIPLYQSGAVRSRVRQAKHVANQRFMDIVGAKRQARQMAVQSWEELLAARAEIEARKAQVEASEIAKEGVNAEAEFGSRTVLDALDADQEYLDAQTALVTAQRNETVAQVQLLSVLGQLTPDTLGFVQEAAAVGVGLEDFKWQLFNINVDRLGER